MKRPHTALPAASPVNTAPQARQVQPGPELEPDLPTNVPGTLVALDRAIMLLGERCKLELRQKKQQELIQLLGAYPDTDQARQWKAALKQLRTDEIWADEKTSG